MTFLKKHAAGYATLLLAAMVAVGCAAPDSGTDQVEQARPAIVELATFPSEWTYQPGAEASAAPNGMIASNSTLATEAGVEILEAGGNAVDAAVAVGFALAAAYPEAGNLGGGGYSVVRLADGESAALDYRETAPAGASRDMYIDADGELTRDSIVGHRASGVPEASQACGAARTPRHHGAESSHGSRHSTGPRRIRRR